MNSEVAQMDKAILSKTRVAKAKQKIECFSLPVWSKPSCTRQRGIRKFGSFTNVFERKLLKENYAHQHVQQIIYLRSTNLNLILT